MKPPRERLDTVKGCTTNCCRVPHVGAEGRQGAQQHRAGSSLINKRDTDSTLLGSSVPYMN